LHVPNQVIRAAALREPAKLPTPQTAAAALTTTVRYSDIDVNHHVNSARYIGWLLDSYPAEFHRDHTLTTLEVNYLGETRWAETLSVCSKERSPLEFSHSILKGDHSELCRADLQWKADSSNKPLPG
jgi:acyl-ACP thioesterase